MRSRLLGPAFVTFVLLPLAPGASAEHAPPPAMFNCSTYEPYMPVDIERLGARVRDMDEPFQETVRYTNHLDHRLRVLAKAHDPATGWTTDFVEHEMVLPALGYLEETITITPPPTVPESFRDTVLTIYLEGDALGTTPWVPSFDLRYEQDQRVGGPFSMTIGPRWPRVGPNDTVEVKIEYANTGDVDLFIYGYSHMSDPTWPGAPDHNWFALPARSSRVDTYTYGPGTYAQGPIGGFTYGATARELPLASLMPLDVLRQLAWPAGTPYYRAEEDFYAQIVCPPEPPAPVKAFLLVENPAVAAGLLGALVIGLAAITVRRDPPFVGVPRWPPWPGLFTRFTHHEVLDHAARGAIHQLITAEPGIAFRALQKRLGMASGTLHHHIRMLQRHGLVASRREGLARRFYPTGVPRPDLPAEPITPTQQRVLDLLRSEAMTQVELANRLGITKQAANQHVKALERRRLVTSERQGTILRWVTRAPDDAVGG